MFRPRPLVVASLSAAVLLAVAANLPGGERGQEAGALPPKTPQLKTPRLDQFGEFYALSVKPDAAALPHKADAHDIVVVFDTSASQSGEFRERGLVTLQAFLAKLNPADRVCVLAVDTSVAPMTFQPGGRQVDRRVRCPFRQGNRRGAGKAQSASPAGLD